MATHGETPGRRARALLPRAQHRRGCSASDDSTKIGGRPVPMLRKHGYSRAPSTRSIPRAAPCRD
ncbi:hypothetical protein ACTMU2_27490 [Cupriavidus basilensis]